MQITIEQLFAKIGALTMQNEVLQARLAQLESEAAQVKKQNSQGDASVDNLPKSG